MAGCAVQIILELLVDPHRPPTPIAAVLKSKAKPIFNSQQRRGGRGGVRVICLLQGVAVPCRTIKQTEPIPPLPRSARPPLLTATNVGCTTAPTLPTCTQPHQPLPQDLATRSTTTPRSRRARSCAPSTAPNRRSRRSRTAAGSKGPSHHKTRHSLA